MTKPGKQRSIPLAWVAGLGGLVPVLSFCGMTIVKVWTVADNIATKSEFQLFRTEVLADFKKTDEAIAKSVEASKKYTDEKAEQVKIEAFDHSDKNKLDMKADTAEIRGQLNAIVTILTNLKIDLTGVRKYGR